MRKTILLGLAAFALAGCPDPNSSTASAPKAATASAGPEPDAAVDPDFCEAKNPEGTNPCKKDSGAGKGSNDPGTESEQVETVAAMIDNFRAECEARKDKLSPEIRAEYIEILNKKGSEAANAYCAYAPLEVVSVEPAKEPSPTYSEPSASSAPESGGGCEWKGRNYSPGDSIHYQSDGRILSSDLFVFGENFGNLSGKSGPWQLCECSTSSGHWGCV